MFAGKVKRRLGEDVPGVGEVCVGKDRSRLQEHFAPLWWAIALRDMEEDELIDIRAGCQGGNLAGRHMVIALGQRRVGVAILALADDGGAIFERDSQARLRRV